MTKNIDTMLKGFIKQGNAAHIRTAIDQLCASGVNPNQIVIDKDMTPILENLETGDHVITLSLYDVSSSLLGLLRILKQIADCGAVLQSIHEPWLDMKSAPGDWSTLLEGLTDFGTQAVSERTRKALSRVKASGKKLGRPCGITEERFRQYQIGVTLYQNSEMSVQAICKMAGIEMRSFYRYLKEAHIETSRRKIKEEKQESAALKR